jgi:trimeric autotransporter adhesin
MGYNSLSANTTGAANVAVGAYALTSNTTGNDNTAVGDVALHVIQQVLQQYESLGRSFYALVANTTASNNIQEKCLLCHW